MRAVVVKEYIDKNTNVFHEVGEKLNITAERFEEISKKGLYLVDISDEVAKTESENETEKTPVKGRRSRTKTSESEGK